jgi:hypothetical protein
LPLLRYYTLRSLIAAVKDQIDGAYMAIEIAAPVCRWGSTETSQMVNGEARSAPSGEHSPR